jgi:hypothetical protein
MDLSEFATEAEGLAASVEPPQALSPASQQLAVQESSSPRPETLFEAPSPLLESDAQFHPPSPADKVPVQDVPPIQDPPGLAPGDLDQDELVGDEFEIDPEVDPLQDSAPSTMAE